MPQALVKHRSNQRPTIPVLWSIISVVDPWVDLLASAPIKVSVNRSPRRATNVRGNQLNSWLRGHRRSLALGWRLGYECGGTKAKWRDFWPTDLVGPGRRISTPSIATQTLTRYGYIGEYHQRFAPSESALYRCTAAEASVRRAIETGITSFTSMTYMPSHRPFSRLEQYISALVVKWSTRLNDSTRSMHESGFLRGSTAFLQTRQGSRAPAILA